MEKIIIVLSFCGFIFFGYVTFIDDQLISLYESRVTKNESIGNSLVIDKNVQRKHSDSLSWYSLRDGNSLFDSDSIFVGEGSSAILELNGQSKIHLNENSLVVLRSQKSQSYLDIQLGTADIELKKGESITIVENDKVIELKSTGTSGKITLKKTEESLKIFSHDSQVELVSEDGQATTIDKGSVGDITESEKIEVKKISFTPILPDRGKVVWTEKTEPINMIWKIRNRNPNLRIQISKNSKFDRIVMDKEIGNGDEVKALVGGWRTGRYYWRVFDSKRAEGENSNYTFFKVKLKKTLKLVYPIENMTLSKDSKEREYEVEFIWGKLKSQYKYNFELSSDRDFTNKIASVKLEKAEYTKALPEGKYFWRVGVEGWNRWSEVSGFRIRNRGEIPNTLAESGEDALDASKKAEEKALQAKVGLTPGDVPGPLMMPSLKNSYPSLERAPSSYSSIETDWSSALAPPSLRMDKSARVLKWKGDAKPYELGALPFVTWKDVPKSKEYELEVSKKPDFQKVKKFKTNSSKWAWNAPEFGKYYVRGRSISSVEDNNSTYSETLSVLLRSPAPKLEKKYEFENLVKSEELLENEKFPIQLKWAELPKVEKYMVKVSKDSEFKTSLIQRKVSSASVDLDIKAPGEYYFKVKALSDKGKTISSFSKAKKIDLKSRLEIDKPVVSEPENGSIIYGFNSKFLLALKWSQAKLAQGYSIQVSRRRDFKKKVIERASKDNFYLLKGKLPVGPIYWRVQAHYKTFKSPWSEVHYFKAKSN